MHETESHLVQWGRRLFEGDPPYYSGYYGGESAIDSGDIYEERYDIADSSNVENDEIIARTLQEEFSQLDVVESAEAEERPENPYRDYPQEASHDYYVPVSAYSSGERSPRGFSDNTGFYGEKDEFDEAVGSTPCSTPGRNEEEWFYSPESAEECGFDDEEMRKRLEDVVSVPHVPKINGEIPSLDEATTDHERLETRLHDLGFVEFKVQGDGNCQFRALSDQLVGDPDRHKIVRRQVVNQLKLHPEIYEEYVPMKYSNYVRQMAKSGEWGDHLTLQAAADYYDVEIRVVTSYENNGCIDILPGNGKSKRSIFLSFWAEVHYNSIYPQSGSDIESAPFRKKKKWWNFKS